MSTDVLVVGGGPAGRALAGACARAGLSTALADPQLDRPFTATYGCWADELPAGIPESTIAARARGRAIAVGTHDLGWEYAVFDVEALRAHLDAQLAGVEVHAGRVSGPAGPGHHRLSLEHDENTGGRFRRPKAKRQTQPHHPHHAHRNPVSQKHAMHRP